MSKILVVTPLKSEMKRLKSQLGNWQFEKTNLSTRLEIEKVSGKEVYFALCALGKPQSALQTQHVIDAIGSGSLDAVFLVGAAGALDDSLAPGSLIVGSETIEHDHKEKFNPRPLPAFENSKLWTEKIATADVEGLQIGRIASGDEDIVDRDRARELEEATQAKAVAWEGAGVARAAKFSNCDFVEIRAITDGANEDSVSDFEKNLTLAMGRIARLLLHIF